MNNITCFGNMNIAYLTVYERFGGNLCYEEMINLNDIKKGLMVKHYLNTCLIGVQIDHMHHFNHFFEIKRIDRNTILLYMPAKGKQDGQLSLTDLNRGELSLS